MLTVIVTLAAAGFGASLFCLGRWYERGRLAALIDAGVALAADMDASMAALEAAEQQTRATAEARVH